MIESFGNLVGVLADTPLPTILVISGLLLIVLSLIDKVVDSIHIPEKRRDLSLKVGGLLTAGGVLLSILTTLPGFNGENGTSAGNNIPVGVTGSQTRNYYVQLTARSSFGEATRDAQRFRETYAEILEELTPKIESVETAQHGTLYRVRFGRFTSSAGGDAVCGRLLAAGAPQCIVVPE